MAKRGGINYVPRVVIDYVGEIQKDKGCSKSEAFKETVRYAEVGRELERIIKLDWSNRVTKQKIKDFMGRGFFGF